MNMRGGAEREAQQVPLTGSRGSLPLTGRLSGFLPWPPPPPAYAVPAWNTSPPHPVGPAKPSTVDAHHLLREASLIPTREGQVPCYHPVIYWYDSMLTPTILIDCKLHVAGPWMSGLLVAVTSSTALGTEEAQYLFVEQRNE